MKREKASQQASLLSIWLYGTLFGIIHSIFVTLTYKKVPNPYMDEEFHINQTREYCAGNWLVWNAMITTPPALYILAVPFFCGIERYVNSVLLPFCFFFLWKLRQKWQTTEPSFVVIFLK